MDQDGNDGTGWGDWVGRLSPTPVLSKVFVQTAGNSSKTHDESIKVYPSYIPLHTNMVRIPCL